MRDWGVRITMKKFLCLYESMARRIARWLWIALISAHVLSATAQSQPNAGSILQTLPPVAAPSSGNPQIDNAIPRRNAISDVEGLKLDIKGFKLSGLTLIPEKEVQTALKPFIGPGRRFQDLLDAATLVRRLLAKKGYFLADTAIPEQKVVDGIVEIAVIEGRIGEVRVVYGDGVRINHTLVDSYLAGLAGGQLIETSTVERALFLISDLQGISVHSTFEPGKQPGTADLVVFIRPQKALAYNLDFDANGSIFTGAYRVGAGIDYRNPLGRGDLLNFKVMDSEGDRLQASRVAYMVPLSGWGTKLGLSYTDLHYKLGTSLFNPLQAHGYAGVASVIGIQPFIRSRNVNLIALLQFDHRRFYDREAVPNLVTLKESDVTAVTLNGDFRDTLMGGGVNIFNLTATSGNLKFADQALTAADIAAHNTHGKYYKTNLTYSRLQAVNSFASIYISYAQQFANRNLDPSEKMSLGGPGAVRAYSQGEAAADEGYTGTVELRHPMRVPESFPPGTSMVASLFHDFGWAHLFKEPLPTDLTHERIISGYGVGLAIEVPNDWFMRASVAQRTDAKGLSEPDRSPRVFLQLSKQF